MEDFEVEEEDLVEEADEVTYLSNVIIVAYWVTTRGILHIYCAHVCIVLRLITLLRTVHN